MLATRVKTPGIWMAFVRLWSPADASSAAAAVEGIARRRPTEEIRWQLAAMWKSQSHLTKPSRR